MTPATRAEFASLADGDVLVTMMSATATRELMEHGLARETWKPWPGKRGQRAYLTITDAGRAALAERVG